MTIEERTPALEAILLEKRRQIRTELAALSQEFRIVDGRDTWDEADRSVYALGRDLRSARLDQLGRMLQQVEDALLRHARGEYGRCQACQADIPLERLGSLPFALYCRECQETREAQEGQVTAGAVQRIALGW